MITKGAPDPPPGERRQSPLILEFTTFEPGQTFSILLETDTDGDGEFEQVASLEVDNTVPPFAAGVLSIVYNGNNTVTVSWSVLGWTLQEANDVTGPWSTSASQTSPVTVPPAGARKFYRLTQP